MKCVGVDSFILHDAAGVLNSSLPMFNENHVSNDTQFDAIDAITSQLYTVYNLYFTLYIYFTKIVASSLHGNSVL